MTTNGIKKNSLEMCGSRCEIYEVRSGVGVLPGIG